MRDWLWAPVLIFAGITAGGLLAPDASADPASDYAAINAGRVCATLHDYPTVDGVTGILAAVIEDSGLSPYQAGKTVAMAVQADCPQYLPVLQAFVDKYAPAPEYRQGYVA